jgi:hypothetical protein
MLFQLFFNPSYLVQLTTQHSHLTSTFERFLNRSHAQKLHLKLLPDEVYAPLMNLTLGWHCYFEQRRSMALP